MAPASRPRRRRMRRWLLLAATWNLRTPRRFGRTVALAGAGGSLAGNAAGHLLATGYVHPGPILVVIVGAIPAAVLVSLAHLAALLSVPAPPHGQQDDFQADDATDTRGAVLHVIRQQPSTIAELAGAIGRSRTTVIGHLNALTRAGVIRRDGSKRYRPTTRPHLIGDLIQQESR